MNTFTTLDTATIGRQQPKPAVAEESLDFAALRKAGEVLAKFRFTSFLVWTDEACAALDSLSESVAALIDMAERCEQWKQKFDERMCQVTAVKQLLESSEAEHQHWHKVADGRLTTIHSLEAERDRLRTKLDSIRTVSNCPPDSGVEQWVTTLADLWQQTVGGRVVEALESERDRLRTQLAEAVAAREYAEQQLAAIESQPSGLSEEEEAALYEVLDRLARFGYRTSVDTLRAIIDRLKRQKVVPWIPVIDGKRPEGRDDESILLVFGDDSKQWLAAGLLGERWRWSAVKGIFRVSNLLATLPKGDATP